MCASGPRFSGIGDTGVVAVIATVIASEAKQSILSARRDEWIASSQPVAVLAMTRLGNGWIYSNPTDTFPSEPKSHSTRSPA